MHFAYFFLRQTAVDFTTFLSFWLFFCHRCSFRSVFFRLICLLLRFRADESQNCTLNWKCAFIVHFVEDISAALRLVCARWTLIIINLEGKCSKVFFFYSRCFFCNARIFDKSPTSNFKAATIVDLKWKKPNSLPVRKKEQEAQKSRI